jgi:calcineurin-like phosphoesterase family protein
MLKIPNDRKVWVTSDCHYAHKNICRGITNWRLPNGDVPEKQTRPFETLDKMNASIVNNINEVVGQDDILINLGDWSFSGFEMIEEFHNRLICKNIHLILGNHDHFIDSNKDNIRKLFLSVSWFDQLNYMGETIELCHYPVSSWNGLKKGRIMLHGHCHLPNEKKISNGRRMDVGMDGHPEFRPYNLLKEIMNPMKKIPIGSELGSDDHHLDDMQGVVG